MRNKKFRQDQSKVQLVTQTLGFDMKRKNSLQFGRRREVPKLRFKRRDVSVAGSNEPD